MTKKKKGDEVEPKATTHDEISKEETILAAPAAANDDTERVDEEGEQPPRIAKPLAMKMAQVMAEVRHVPKNGRNAFHKYDYIMESDLIDQLRGKLSSRHIAIFPSIRDHRVEAVNDSRGRTTYLATVSLEITFIDGDSGDQMTTVWVGQGLDQGDKSYYKAYTGAFKYALLKTFLVTGEEDAPSPQRAPRQRRHA